MYTVKGGCYRDVSHDINEEYLGLGCTDVKGVVESSRMTEVSWYRLCRMFTYTWTLMTVKGESIVILRDEISRKIYNT